MAGKPLLKYDRKGSSEWYTPPEWIERVRAALGGVIDLDAASCPEAQQTVQANRYFSEHDNALLQKWTASNVFLNPPGTRDQDIWVKHLVSRYKAGEFEQAIFLMFKVATDTGWFHYLMRHARVICFVRGRIKFAAPAGEYDDPTKSSPPVTQAFVYLGNTPALFYQHFENAGTIMHTRALS